REFHRSSISYWRSCVVIAPVRVSELVTGPSVARPFSLPVSPNNNLADDSERTQEPYHNRHRNRRKRAPSLPASPRRRLQCSVPGNQPPQNALDHEPGFIEKQRLQVSLPR